MTSLAHNPALIVELGAAFVLVAAVLSRVLLSRLGIPSIVTLLAFGLAAGPSGFGLLHVDLTDPATRALLQLAVVVVLFEATLRMDLRGISKTTIAVMVALGAALSLIAVPHVAAAFHLSALLRTMIAAICIVTGPTVIGPLMARLRPRTALSHLLESEGLVLDALGVIIASAVFATYTSRPGVPLDAAGHVVARIGAGVAVGLFWGLLGRAVLRLTARSSSDLSKLSVLFLGFAAYASADWLAHESGLVAVVVCGLLLDFHLVPHERLLRVFKEDLSMLALSTVFVLLASQIRVDQLGPLVLPAAAIVGMLIATRFVTVALSTLRSTFTMAERLLMFTVFPRGIVAVSLATYYATQIPAWGLHGGTTLAGILFLIVIFTIAISTPASIAVAHGLRLQMSSVVLAGITPSMLQTAQLYKRAGHLPFMVDTDEYAVALAHSQDLEAAAIDEPGNLLGILRERRPAVLIVEGLDPWKPALRHASRHSIRVLTNAQARDAVEADRASSRPAP